MQDLARGGQLSSFYELLQNEGTLPLQGEWLMFRGVLLQPDQIQSYRSQVNIENLIHLPHRLPFDQRSDELSLLLEIPFIPADQPLFIQTRCHWIPHQVWVVGPDLIQPSQPKINCGTSKLDQSKPGWQEASWSINQDGRHFILIHLRNPDKIPSVYFEPPTIRHEKDFIPTSFKIIGFGLALLAFQFALWHSHMDRFAAVYIGFVTIKWLLAENILLVVFNLANLAQWQKLNLAFTSVLFILLSRPYFGLQVLSLFLAALFGSFLIFLESQSFFKHFHTWQALSLGLFIPAIASLPVSELMNLRQGVRIGLAIALILGEDLLIPGQHLLTLWPFALGLVAYDLEQSVRTKAT
ncbi:hypothetical protein SAMN06296036_104226 [Pseudobacteriovorax antillogorgiicola]|uniref:7TM diverse intracellular signalling n=2 Tax=Pseudobacteriovorax antillogorgiicola TaxID=1513793 RepID=A0A1Y6BG74_9BACT|nr:hypothetical protein EDD56_104107 [Pseudobacteriovorax antillogorgiicola]SMF07614.1 hypothetical protein SAMN06296036_104226 [Pseudobacteriovorax antillogorgiicola]